MLQGIDFIDNDNILYGNICDDGLHINQGGAKRFARNVKRYVEYWQGYTGSEKNLNKSQRSIGKQTNRGLRIAALNVVSLRKHHSEIEHVRNEHKLHILGLNETRLSKDIKDLEVFLEGFEIHRKDRDVNGGGVAVYVNSSISHNRRQDIDDPLLEIVAVEISPLHARNLIVICWYRPPTQGNDKDSFSALRNLLSAIDAEGKEIILIGDTNCHLKIARIGAPKT